MPRSAASARPSPCRRTQAWRATRPSRCRGRRRRACPTSAARRAASCGASPASTSTSPRDRRARARRTRRVRRASSSIASECRSCDCVEQVAQPRVVDCHASSPRSRGFECASRRCSTQCATRMSAMRGRACASGDVADRVGRVVAHRHAARDLGGDREAAASGPAALNATVPGSRPSTPSEIVPVRVMPHSW